MLVDIRDQTLRIDRAANGIDLKCSVAAARPKIEMDISLFELIGLLWSVLLLSTHCCSYRFLPVSLDLAPSDRAY